MARKVGSVRDLSGTSFCKNRRKSAYLLCPFNVTPWIITRAYKIMGCPAPLIQTCEKKEYLLNALFKKTTEIRLEIFSISSYNLGTITNPVT
jgi:hypothetical protein